jgi:hypothetical protein
MEHTGDFTVNIIEIGLAWNQNNTRRKDEKP